MSSNATRHKGRKGGLKPVLDGQNSYPDHCSSQKHRLNYFESYCQKIQMAQGRISPTLWHPIITSRTPSCIIMNHIAKKKKILFSFLFSTSHKVGHHQPNDIQSLPQEHCLALPWIISPKNSTRYLYKVGQHQPYDR